LQSIGGSIWNELQSIGSSITKSISSIIPISTTTTTTQTQVLPPTPHYSFILR
jgi:hypothetical protein